MSLRSLGVSALLVLVLACEVGTARRSPPAAYPPQYGTTPAGYPPGQYPPNQYPPGQYPPPQYPPAAGAAAPPQQPYPPAAAPIAVPNATNDPINGLDRAWLRQRSQAILAELVAALPDATRSHVQNIPLVVDDTPGDVNAFAACADGRALMAVTDGLLEITAFLAMAAAHDELFQTTKTDEYIRFIAQNLAPERPIPRPAGFFPAATQNDGRKVLRQHVIFEEQLAFILAHELAHHHLGHLPCTGSAGPLGSADIARVLASRVPVLNQPYETAADLAGTTNVLDAGARRNGPHWSESGGLLTMRFFIGLEGGGAANILLAFQHSHPSPHFRIPLIQQSANYWRRNGGVGFPIPRLGG